MVVRLAEKQGLLSQRKITPFQHFALTYSLALERRQKLRDDEEFVQHLTAVMDPIRFRQVYLENTIPHESFEEIPGFEVEPDDFSDIDRYLSSLDKTRTGRG